ncbi:MAG: GAF domain-containing protein, partial [Dehalococcoidia bacterium]
PIFAGFPLILDDRLVGAMVVYRHVPLRPVVRDALALLAQQAALALEHARLIDESQTLQEVAAGLAATRDADALAATVVRRTAAAFGADAGAIWLIDDRRERLHPIAVHGLSDAFLRRMTQAGQETVTLTFADLQRDPRPRYSDTAAAAIRSADPWLADALAQERILGVLRLPLLAPDNQTAGMLVLYHRNERRYSANEIRFAQTFANQIAVALQNARLAEQERRAQAAAARRLDRLTAVHQITEQLLTTTEQETVLRVVVEAATRLSDGATGIIALLDAGGERMTLAAADGPLASDLLQAFPDIVLDEPTRSSTAMGRAIGMGKTVVVEDYQSWPMESAVRDRSLALGVRSFIAAPLRAGGRSLGLLWVGETAARPFADEDVMLIEALADQAALAIEHTRLVVRGQEAAVLEERARLARDLHDSVTQSLFSVSMLTSAALTQYARNAPALATTLDRAEHLAQEALTEMRALLYELRPEALTAEGLAAALEKLVDAVRMRTDVPITFTAACDQRLAPEIETAIFRIVQESLANAVKHARASSIQVTLVQVVGGLTAIVADDGTGFDPTTAPGPPDRRGGLGLRSMRERATAGGLVLDIQSAPGRGTAVTIRAAERVR